MPPFNAYSADGDVVGDLVYVNQGLPKDYEELERHGIDVRGKIVIARYGGSWRGIKPKVAAEKGAVGCIIYNDPSEDGFAHGDAYPNGAFKHDTAVQRGSVIDLPLRPGDPLTPGYGATKDARRLKVSESDTIMKIPVLPICYEDALPFFRALKGPLAPASWRGAMPTTYRLGGDDSTKVRLKLEFNWDLVPAYNVIARLEGSLHPDQWILRGNHHDAWVVGARDPISGVVAVLEQARAIGELAKTGWRPQRTLVFCLWDAEEPGLLGSTEWVEQHAKELREKAVCYINTDGNARGFLRVQGSHSLERLVTEVAGAVTDPQTGVSVAERWRAMRRVRGTAEQKKQARSQTFFPVGALGSGSDYTAFLHHLGISSLDVRFGGEGIGGEYHTMFDTYDHFSRFIDPEFDYEVALTQVCGRLMLRLAQADDLPFDFQPTVREIEQYIVEAEKLVDTMREETAETNQLIEEGLFELADDPGQETRRAEEESARAAHQLRAAAERAGNAEDQRRWLGRPPAILSGPARSELPGAAAAGTGSDPLSRRTGPAARRGPAPPAVVPSPDLCSRILHGLRGQDSAGRPGKHRGATMGRGRRTDRPRGGGHPEARRADRCGASVVRRGVEKVKWQPIARHHALPTRPAIVEVEAWVHATTKSLARQSVQR